MMRLVALFKQTKSITVQWKQKKIHTANETTIFASGGHGGLSRVPHTVACVHLF